MLLDISAPIVPFEGFGDLYRDGDVRAVGGAAVHPESH